jgi:hypothetical protein
LHKKKKAQKKCTDCDRRPLPGKTRCRKCHKATLEAGKRARAKRPYFQYDLEDGRIQAPWPAGVIYTGYCQSPAGRWNFHSKNTERLNSEAKRGIRKVADAGALRMRVIGSCYTKSGAKAAEDLRITTLNTMKKALGLPPLLNKNRSYAKSEIPGLVFHTDDPTTPDPKPETAVERMTGREVEVGK